MPLLDHFHPPLSSSRRWSSFHARWAVAIADSLNASLPSPRFLAETEVSIGREFKTDVVEFDQSPDLGNGDDAVAVATYAPPQAARSVAVAFSEEIAVRVYDFSAGRTLVGVLELVSPANKDRADTRRAFATKCATILHDRIGLIVVDVVSEYHGNLHREVLGLLGDAQPVDLPTDCYLYAVAYRPVLRQEQCQLDLWPVSLAIGQTLPILPLALRGSFLVPIDLEATYTEARQRCHL